MHQKTRCEFSHLSSARSRLHGNDVAFNELPSPVNSEASNHEKPDKTKHEQTLLLSVSITDYRRLSPDFDGYFRDQNFNLKSLTVPERFLEQVAEEQGGCFRDI